MPGSARRGIAALVAAVLACGGPQAPVRPVALTGVVKHYAPLAMAVDAAAPELAVVLGSDDRDGSTVLALPPGPHTVVVEAVTPGALRAIALTAGAMTIGTEPGTRWPAELARARRVASQALGKQLGEITLGAVAVTPPETGATAAVMAGGFLAALTGEAIDPRATLIGTLGPDGTIGPVAALPDQVLAAIAHGKTRIGVPRGMRRARSQAGAVVDVVQLAAARHAEVIELADVHDAYVLLTRKQLPAAVPAAEADLALTADERAGLEAEYRAWQARLASQWAALLQLEQAGRLPSAIARQVRAAHEHSARAEPRRRSGQLDGALAELRAAWIDARTANATSALVGQLAAGDVDGAVAAMIALDPAPRVRAAFEAAAAARATIGGELATIVAMQAALRGWAEREAAADAVRAAAEILGGFRGKPATTLGAPATASAAAEAAAPAVHAMLRAEAELVQAEHALDHGDRSVAHAAAPARVRQAAAALLAVATVELRDADPASDDKARPRLAPADAFADRWARDPSGLPAELAAAWGDDAPGTGLLQLAAAALVQREAARRLVRREAPGDHADPLVAAQLRERLAAAQRAARARARAARVATGAIPLQAKLTYQRAALAAAGGVDDQLDALAELWTATDLLQLAIVLARS